MIQEITHMLKHVIDGITSYWAESKEMNKSVQRTLDGNPTPARQGSMAGLVIMTSSRKGMALRTANSESEKIVINYQ